MVRLVVAEPGYYAYLANFKSVQDAIQEVLGDDYMITQPFDTPKVGLICSEKQYGKPFNRALTDDVSVHGRFLICGMNNGKPVSLTAEQGERYKTRYYLVQSENMGDEFPVGKVRPKDERFGKTLHFWER